MNEAENPRAIPAGIPVMPMLEALDWRAVAEQRLTRLVDIEHDYSVMCERLGLLQVDYREVLVANEERLQRIDGLERERQKLHERLAELSHQHANMLASFVESRSWRITRPLRVATTWWRSDGRHPAGLVRSMLRVSLFRRAARRAVRLVPGLHARLRSRLYPPAGNGTELH